MKSSPDIATIRALSASLYHGSIYSHSAPTPTSVVLYVHPMTGVIRRGLPRPLTKDEKQLLKPPTVRKGRGRVAREADTTEYC